MIIVVAKLDIQLSKIYLKSNKEKLSKLYNKNMVQTDEIRNEYKQQLKDKISLTQNSDEDYK